MVPSLWREYTGAGCGCQSGDGGETGSPARNLRKNGSGYSRPGHPGTVGKKGRTQMDEIAHDAEMAGNPFIFAGAKIDLAPISFETIQCKHR